jgi:hypothetical protein
MPAAVHGDKVIGAAVQLGADVFDDQISGGPTTRARTSSETGSFDAKIAASTQPIHARQRASGASASRAGELLGSCPVS